MNLQEKIKALIIEMREMLIRSGVSDERITRKLSTVDKWKDTEIALLERAITDLYNGAHKECMRIWTLPHINREMWDNYTSLFGLNDLPEQVMLRNALRVLRIGFSKLPGRPKNGNHSKEGSGTFEGAKVQPEGEGTDASSSGGQQS